MKKKPIWEYAITALALSISLEVAATPTTAQLTTAQTNGLVYLVKQHQGDGNWGTLDESKIKDTSAVILTLNHFGVRGDILRRGLTWLANAEPYTPDLAARKLSALIDSDIYQDELAAQIFNMAHTIQNDSVRVWGSQNKHRPSIQDTALVLEALLKVGNLPGLNLTDLADQTIQYYLDPWQLNESPTSAGGAGWSDGLSTLGTTARSQVAPTAYALLTLNQKGGFWWGADAAKAAEWLAFVQKTDGSFGDVTGNVADTALVVLALGKAKNISGAPASVTTAYQKGRDYLISKQKTNGSWLDDPFISAISLRALFELPSALTDSDSDGLPNTIETALGKNPNLVDTDWLAPGNGKNYTHMMADDQLYELLVGRSFTKRIATEVGSTTITAGLLPPGLQFATTTATISGTPTAQGSYGFSYKVAAQNGAIKFGSVQISVVAYEADTDHDGVSSGDEITWGMNPLNANDIYTDIDHDGLLTSEELALGLHPNNKDTDADGMNDGWEFSFSSSGIDANGDLDSDTLSNLNEFKKGSDPLDQDTDRDGVSDGQEVTQSRNPTVYEGLQ